MCWQLFLEEFQPTFHHIKGENNSLADALSRLPFSERQNTNNFQNKPCAQAVHTVNTNTLAIIDDDNLLDCFVNLPDQTGTNFVLDYKTIAAVQSWDAELLALAAENPQKYPQQMLTNNTRVYCYISEPNAPWKIYLSNELLQQAVQWYHLALCHAGMTRLYNTMSMHFYNPQLKHTIEDMVARCDTCQWYKAVGRGHGDTAPRETPLLPWREVAVDLIGPWTLQIQGEDYTFQALTIIDMVTNLVEITRLESKSSEHVAMQFNNHWLARYPHPIHCIHDQGGEFT